MKQFHGQNKKHSFFEGWYLKHQAGDVTLALIPAFHVDKHGHKSASLQVITNNASYNIPFAAEEFQADQNHFYIRLGANTFSPRGISLNIDTDGLFLKGSLRYGAWTPPTSDVMGPFRHIPIMQCNHGVLSFSHTLTGSLNLNGWVLDFNGGNGYIEKDWGRSFPSSYVWTQCNWKQKNSGIPGCIIVSVADIPLLFTHFTGCICAISCEGKEYRLATYKGARILEYTDQELVISQGHYLLHVNLLGADPKPLHAPSSGSMVRTIYESPACHVRYQFFNRRKKVFHVVSRRAGFETGGDIRRV